MTDKNTINFNINEPAPKTIMTISENGVWVDPEYPVTETARLVLDALSEHVGVLIQKAVKREREDCAKVCDARYMGDNNREDMEARRCAAAIRARGEK